MSRPRLIETWKFAKCRDRDQSRLGNLLDVETETSRDWAKDVDTETPSRLMLISDMVGLDFSFLQGYISHQKSEFDAVKNNLSLINEFILIDCF